MATAINLYAGTRSDGSPVEEEVLVEERGGDRYQLVKSPGLVLGVAGGDIIRLSGAGRFQVIKPGRESVRPIILRSTDSGSRKWMPLHGSWPLAAVSMVAVTPSWCTGPRVWRL